MSQTTVPLRTHVTRGQVEAVFNAFGSGGWAVLRHSRIARGAPADFLGSHGAIVPYSDSPWDHAHLCADDWHVALAADIEGGDTTFTRMAAESIMQGLDFSFTLDGAPLGTRRTPIKRFLNPGMFDMEVAFYFEEGHILAPEDLALGRHTLEVTLHDDTGRQHFRDGIVFFVDPSPNGACQPRPGP